MATIESITLACPVPDYGEYGKQLSVREMLNNEHCQIMLCEPEESSCEITGMQVIGTEEVASSDPQKIYDPDQAFLDRIRKESDGATHCILDMLLLGQFPAECNNIEQANIQLFTLLKQWQEKPDNSQIIRIWRKSGLYRTELDAPEYFKERIPKQKPQPSRPLTDCGNAERLIDDNPNKLMYVRGKGDKGDWYMWVQQGNGGKWKEDSMGYVPNLAKCSARRLGKWALGIEDEDYRKTVVNFALASESERAIKAAVNLARNDNRITVDAASLNQDPWLFNVENGTIDLRNGQLRPASPEDLITQMANVAYDPSAICPVFNDFVLDIMDGNQALVGYLQRLLGMCLTGDNTEHVLPVLWGNGRNGKNTLLDTVLHILGSGYAAPVPATVVATKTQNDRHPTELAKLWGLRLGIASETDENARICSGQIKALTGDEIVTARFMHRDFFDFKRTHKIFLITNNKPEITDTSDGMWQRLKLIPFTKKYLYGINADTQLPAKLKAEAPGILNWLIKGCLDWQVNGLQEPSEVTTATQAYRDSQDSFGQFMQDTFVPDPNGKIARKQVGIFYEEWASSAGYTPMKPHVLYSRVKELGYSTKTINGTVYFSGLKWKGLAA